MGGSKRPTTVATTMFAMLALAMACIGVHADPRVAGVDEKRSNGKEEEDLSAAFNRSSPRPTHHLHPHRRHLTQGLRGGGLVDIDVDATYDRLEQSGNKIPKIFHLLWVTKQLPRFAEGYKLSLIHI